MSQFLKIKKWIILTLFCFWVIAVGIYIHHGSKLLDNNINNDSESILLLKKLPSGLILKKGIISLIVYALILISYLFMMIRIKVNAIAALIFRINLFCFIIPNRSAPPFFKLLSNLRL